MENTFTKVVPLLYQQMIHTAGQNKIKIMPSLFFLPVKVIVLVLTWLQLFYLANSLVARVDHCASSRRGRQCQQKQKQWDNDDGNSIHNHRSILCGTTISSYDRLFRRKHAVGTAASTTAIYLSSTDNNDHIDADTDDTSSSSPQTNPSPRSLNEILEVLTNRGISFSPLASRAELEELLDSVEAAESRPEERHPYPGPKTPTVTTKVSSMPSEKNVGDDNSSEVGSKRNRQQPRQEQRRQQQQQQQREIEDRLQRRANRTRRSSSSTSNEESLGDERIYDDNDTPPSPTSRQGRQRQRRREGELWGPRESIEDDYYSDDVVQDGEDSDGTRLRRRRRRQRLEQEPPSLLDSISSNLPVTEIVGIGARASRIARKKTGKLWKDIVDSTYYDEDDNEMMYEGKYYGSDTDFRQSQRQSRSRPSRRERRRSGFNWQPQQPSRPAREAGGSQRQRRRRRSESASTDYYNSSDEKEPVIGREESLQRQKREQRQEARQRQQQRPYDGAKNQNKPFSSTTRSRMDSFAKTTRGKLSTNGKLPIDQILDALEQRNISYSPSASRKELEDLLMNGLENNNDVVAVKKAEEDAEVVIEVDWISPEDWKKQQEEKLQQKQNEQERDKEQKQKQHQHQHQPNSNSTGEKSNPRPEPPKGGTTTTTTTTSSSTSIFYRRSVNNSYRPSGFSATTAKAYGTGASARERRRRQSQQGPTPRTAAAAAAASSSPPSENSLGSNTSDADASESTIRSSASKRKTALKAKMNEGKVPRTSQTSRRIYSPFGGGQGSESTETTSANTRSSRKNKKKNDFVGIEDDLDRFGNVIEDDLGKFGDFLANSVDNVFWGTSHDDEIESATPSSSNRNKGGEEHEPSNRRTRSRKRHWKDRAEERLDKLLGVHKVGGKTYDRWVEKEATDAEEDEARGYDAVSYTKGRKRKRSTKKRKAFWEEDESIMSVLLGHNWDDSRPPQRSLRSNLDDIREAFRSGNTLTVLLRNLLVVSARIVESLCNWASVRDTIPRPVVFLGALGTGFVSRPGDRIKNTLLAFLSVRVLGEWLSGHRAKPRKGRTSDVPRNDDVDE